MRYQEAPNAFARARCCPHFAEKIVTVELFEPHCAACRALMPILQKVREKCAGGGVTALVHDADATRDGFLRFLTRNPSYSTCGIAVGAKLRGRCATSRATKMPHDSRDSY